MNKENIKLINKFLCFYKSCVGSCFVDAIYKGTISQNNTFKAKTTFIDSYWAFA